jgi:hypothetical protein
MATPDDRSRRGGGVADLQANASADARVHLVEHQRGNTVEASEDGLERQHTRDSSPPDATRLSARAS